MEAGRRTGGTARHRAKHWSSGVLTPSLCAMHLVVVVLFLLPSLCLALSLPNMATARYMTEAASAGARVAFGGGLSYVIALELIRRSQNLNLFQRFQYPRE